MIKHNSLVVHTTKWTRSIVPNKKFGLHVELFNHAFFSHFMGKYWLAWVNKTMLLLYSSGKSPKVTQLMTYVTGSAFPKATCICWGSRFCTFEVVLEPALHSCEGLPSTIPMNAAKTRSTTCKSLRAIIVARKC
jgi:hypothetical protein